MDAANVRDVSHLVPPPKGVEDVIRPCGHDERKLHPGKAQPVAATFDENNIADSGENKPAEEIPAEQQSCGGGHCRCSRHRPPDQILPFCGILRRRFSGYVAFKAGRRPTETGRRTTQLRRLQSPRARRWTLRSISFSDTPNQTVASITNPLAKSTAAPMKIVV